jgi:hypothetical protein
VTTINGYSYEFVDSFSGLKAWQRPRRTASTSTSVRMAAAPTDRHPAPVSPETGRFFFRLLQCALPTSVRSLGQGASTWTAARGPNP